ncbi:hypothetical protein SELSPUOL_00072 [Selenomonas sputigena ATCC 35185]|uniref:Uncharacterized protein n=1 Tax=Selenomonas sputigena (strain ATCC 35185 / DSM 20758 / CCUG 44933 / VPI D19B-28) TaxID=546271 RepID=C9LRK6_SELS3|nr:hypothetical protein SELSPUOL_00072 [Selenomonas sputigena ATCC 35185]
MPLKIVQEAARTALFTARREKGAFISWIVCREALLSAAASTKFHHSVTKDVNAS